MVRPTSPPSLSSFLLVSCACVLLLLLLLGCPLPASAQSYHYSNGWNPGKRGGYGAASGLTTATDSGAEDDLCLFRPKVLAFINKAIMDEISRIEQLCYPVDAVSGLKALLQQSAAAQSLSSAGAKMSEDNAKSSW